jgi:hypothetical protein
MHLNNTFVRQFIWSLLLLSVVTTKISAQVSAYSFTQNISGTGYVPLTGGTVAFASPWDDDAPVQVPIGFNFSYDNTVFTNCYISPNGFITFGATPPTVANYTPMSTATIYNPGNTGGAVAAMGVNLSSNGSAIEYGVIGSAPNRIFVVQWTNANRKTTAVVPGDFDFQIQLSETTNAITFSYGNCDTTQSPTSVNVQVGMRGFDNNLVQGNVFNRVQGSSQLWGNAGATIQGAVNTATLFTNGTAYPNYGLQFIFAPGSPCTTPTELPTALVLGSTSITSTSFVGNSFTPPVNPPTKYMVLRSLTNTPPTSAIFVNRTVYPVGTTVSGYLVVMNSNLTAFNQTGLASNTTYYYWVIPYNDKCIGAPYYNLNTPLSASATTCFASTVALAASSVGGNGFTANWTSVTGATSYSIDVSTSNTFASFVTGYNNLSIPTGTTSLVVSGLLPSTTYYYRVRANGPGCVVNSATITATTTCGYYTIPYTQNFDTTLVGNVPVCYSVLNNNADTNQWKVQAVSFTSSPRSIQIDKNPAADMNDWFIMPGLNLTGGVSYRLTFRYNTGSVSGNSENLSIYYGTSQTSAGMVNNLLSLPGITNNFFETEYVDFTPGLSGVYYIGFYGSSLANQTFIAIDDISVTLSPSCIDPSNLNVTAIGSTTASLSWTASTVSPSQGYEYYLSTTSTPPTAATVATGSVGAGVTTLNLTGLSPSTYYWIWVRGNCGAADKSVWTTEETFNTECSTPTITATIPVTRCGYGNGTLTANSSVGSTIRWYATSTGSTVLGTGNTITTPNTLTNITYYAEARAFGAIAKTGPVNPTLQLGTRTVQNYTAKVDFTVNSSTTLQSVDIFPMVSGQAGRFIVRTIGNVPVATINYTTNVSGGNTLQTIAINANLLPGNYYLFFETVPTSGIRMNSTNGVYPYSSSVASIDGNDVNAVYYLGAYNWKFTTECLSTRTPVTLTVTSPPALTLSATDFTICEDETTPLVTVSGSGSYDTFTWSPSTGVSGSIASGFTFNPTVTTTYTLLAVQSGGSLCGNITSITINVKAAPPAVSILPVNPTICQGSTLQLFGSTSVATPSVVLNENFNSPINSWVVANTSTGGTPVNSQFTLQPTGYNYINAFGWDVTFTSNDSSQFYLANSDAQSASSGTVTRTTLTSPVFDLVGYTSANINFYHYIRFISGDKFWIQVSTDSGATWTTLQSYNSSQGTASAFSNSIVNLTPYLGMSNLKIQFYYESNWGYCWAIDNVKISGTLSAALTWSPTTHLFTDAACTVPYTAGAALTSVYTNSPNTITYQATLTGSNGCARTGVSNITVSLPTVAGVLGDSQIVCTLTTPSNLNLTGNVGNVVRWESADDAGFTVNVVNIANTTTTLTSAQMGTINPIKYYRVLVKSGACNQAYSNVVSIAVPVTTWNGTSWNNGAPSSTVRAIFAGNYTSTGDLNACSVRVNSGTITFNSGHSLIVQNDVVVAAGSLVFNDTASLVQVVDGAVNTGNITYKRTALPMRKFDFTYWSSPVASQVLNVFSPVTPADKFFVYDPVSVNWVNVLNTSTMTPGKGYIIRAPSSFNPVTTSVFNGTFSGVPNNGPITTPVLFSTTNYNLIGNPFPSAVSADAFLSHPTNVGLIDATLYFWTHNTPMTNNNYTNNDYAIYNYLGGTGTSASVSTGINTAIPNGKIAAGQGFFVKSLASGNVLFSNAMRIAGNNNQFFRIQNGNQTQVSTAHRYWLEVTNGTGAFKQTLIGYASDATLGIDRGFDSDFIDVGLPMSLYSILPGGHTLSIQGRGLPFDASDIVPLGFKSTTLDDYTIHLPAFDGLFDFQNIYLKDRYLNIIHDLKAGDYYFRSNAGTFNDRFQIIYSTNLLNTIDFDSSNTIIVYHVQDEIRIHSQVEILDQIKVYDVRGVLLASQKDIKGFEATFDLALPDQVLLFEIQTSDGKRVVRKYVK